MKSEIMEKVLTRLNGKLKRKMQKILLFMDNATCHPQHLADDIFSNITIKFLPNNTFCKTQSLKMEDQIQEEVSAICLHKGRWSEKRQ